jgi:hypothetical protein
MSRSNDCISFSFAVFLNVILKNYKLKYTYIYLIVSDQKENKSEQALQTIGQVVAEFYANKRWMHGRRQFVLLHNHNKS